MNWIDLYLLTLIPNVKDVLTGLAVVSSIALLSSGVAYGVSLDGDDTGYKAFRNRLESWFPKIAIVLALSCTLATLLPSKNDLMFIVGGSVLLEAAQSDRAQGIADQSLKIVEKWLADQSAAK